MRKTLILILASLIISGNAESKKHDYYSRILGGPFFQDTKWFCCDYRKGKYKLTIKGSAISITLSYNENEST